MSKLLEQINTATRNPYRIKDMGRVVTGKTPSKNNPEDWGSEIDFITPTDIKTDDKFYINSNRKLSEMGKIRFKNMIVPPKSILVTCIGTVGKVIMNKENALSNQQINTIVVNNEKFDNNYVFYKMLDLIPVIRSSAIGSTMPIINKSSFEEINFEAPDLPTQKKIAEILSAYDSKIENNNKIIKNLEATAQTIFNEWFVNFKFPGYEKVKMIESEMGEIPERWEVKSLDNICDISIGRTPPRQEYEWFSRNPKDVKWISIKDLGAGGIFISNTDEYLTKEAVERFNIPIIPEGTLVVSFKLTLGRVAITTENMLSNEAIAHLKIKKTESMFTEFLYLLMKNYNYDSLGSTSSIATAVNSKTIKNIKVVCPDKKILNEFKKIIKPLFEMMHIVQIENKNLKELRDQLLAKLI